MNKNYESVYHNEEEKNWWFVARRDMLLRFFEKYDVPKNAYILDIGCAGGSFLIDLKNRGYNNLYALDYSAEAIELARPRGIENAFVMDGHNPEFSEEMFDVIISSDSLEHLERDEIALGNWYRILKKGGLGFILVPAYNFLWTAHDDINYHFRRYTRSGLVKKVRVAGFKAIFAGYNYCLLFLPTSVVRLAMKLFKRKVKNEGQILMLPTWVNNALITYQKLENSIGRLVGFPFGVSVFVVVRK